MNDGELIALYEQMKDAEGATMDFTCDRTARTAAQQPGTTFSADALNEMLAGMRVWLWTRCFRALDGKTTHRSIRVSMTVEIDGEQEAGVPVVMEVIDGSLRIKAMGGE